MKNYLYVLIANTINSECKCFQVQNIFQRQLSAITVSGRIESAPCRAMTLRIRRKTPNYKKGMMWHIPEFELDRAVTSLKQYDIHQPTSAFENGVPASAALFPFV